ncbi:hypothetical protein EKN06_03320 [Croceicoccus ponticola]|uniref:Proteinase inhibitor I78 n=1 Tax=Croceicoccus ponticola TaxID=2217664 RepID=A0A437H130_9SPHN|nr:I78 family peptidase inhibitor [Croceicoccus ponticola]RVQ69243.1 hypothetical protein EKN06_03320 [Croceicoccus ponticola]
MIRPGLLLALPLLAACSAVEEPGDAPAGTPSPSGTPVAAATWTPPEQCPDASATDRPSGSNCFGLMPQGCGANRAVAYVGQPMTARIAAVLKGFAAQGVRVIGPDEAVDADVVAGRLNVMTDPDGTITSVDCF